MSIYPEDLDRMETDAERTLSLKLAAAKEGHDWVVDSHSMGSHKLVEIVALARLGLQAQESLPGLIRASKEMMKIADPDGDCTDIWAVAMRAALAKATGAT